MEEQSKIISFEPELPCGALIGNEKICSRPATVGSAYREQTIDGYPTGQWLLLPMCKQCSEAMKANYEQIEDAVIDPESDSIII